MCDNARDAVDSGLARIGKDINKLLKKIRNSTNVPIYQPYIQFFPLRVVLCQESSWRSSHIAFLPVVCENGNISYKSANPCYGGSKEVQAAVDILISTVDLLYIADYARAFGRHGSQEQGNTGTDVGGAHIVGTQCEVMVMADNHCTMWIAQEYLRPHVDKAVDKKQAAFKHLLMYQHAAFTLGCHNKHYA